MKNRIVHPARIKAAGNKAKIIEEYIGRVNTGTTALSIARMISPGGWTEPAQTPAFDEYSVVLKGVLRVQTHAGEFDIGAGQAVVAPANEWVRYSTPTDEGAEYIAVCIPAFSLEGVRRE